MRKRVFYFQLVALLLAEECGRCFQSSYGQWPVWTSMARPGTARRCFSDDAAAAQVLRLPGAVPKDLETLRLAFRKRARAVHPDAGGSTEDFQELRRAYVLLRKRLNEDMGAVALKRKLEEQRQHAEWERWEADVSKGLELAQEGDVIYWRPASDQAWNPAIVLAVQVVYEPSSGPHGWIYLQPFLAAENEAGHFHVDEDADMEQVEPVSLDGVNWCFAASPEEEEPGLWRFRPPAYLPP